MVNVLQSYMLSLFEAGKAGDATEQSYYASLSALIESLAVLKKRKHIKVTTLPKRTEAGNPDFRVWCGGQNIVGYIEAKAPDIENLEQIETTDQLKRYLHTFPNLILTNFYEFRLYRNGQLVDNVRVGRPFIAQKLKTVPPLENQDKLLELIERFLNFTLPRTYTAKALAMELAKRTRFLKDQVIKNELNEEKEKGSGFILGFYEAFRKYLIAGLSEDDFADLYSQTITYGLFAARTRSDDGFNRKLAYDYIPRTIGILRDIFKYISLGELPQQMEWIVDDISNVLAAADVNKILRQFYRDGKGSDPIVHFYETFLAEYNPKERERRGVYYTPESVVSYIDRSVNIVLKERFSKSDGFASDSVTVLDPAAGTLTFLAEASRLAIMEFTAKYGEGGKVKFIEDHILRDFYAFEIMMAPYAVGHLKMSFLLDEMGYRMNKDERFKMYLTNTLEMEEFDQTTMPGMASLAEESHLAGKVKKDIPILVILGNPPYSGISANPSEKTVVIKKGQRYITGYRITGGSDSNYYRLVPQSARAKRNITVKQKTWIGELIEDYKIVDGQWFGERKHWLQDDYVKFIRFAQWKLDQAGEGVLGFITNHGYLDNPTFRGMRQSLMESFDEIYILDLHGNTLKKEKCPDESRDENIFDIRQGVAIALFIKKKGLEKKVFHHERWGLRQVKDNWLLQKNIKTTEWDKLSPNSPYYWFVPKKEENRQEYEKYWKVTDIFPVNVTGIVTARDDFVIDFDQDALKRRIRMFRDLNMPDEVIREAFKLKDTRGWKLGKAREGLIRDQDWGEYFTKILYRPFDIREIYYTAKMVDWGRPEVMRHMMPDNIGLCTNREVNGDFKHVLCTCNIINDCTVSSETKERTYLFPLYLYPDTNKKDLFSHMESAEREPNINPKLVQSIAQAYEADTSPEAIFYYIYGILYANSYRTKYAEFLKSDFPRVPFTRDRDLFYKIGDYGKKLADFHLIKSADLDNPAARFQGVGDNKVEKQRYGEKEKRVYINKTQYFEDIDNTVWEYHIGGYQVAAKWLKDRKGRPLSVDDIKHYCKVITALSRTIDIQKEIDALYGDVEKDILEAA